MNRVATELCSISDDLKKCLTVEFKKVEPDKADFINAICADIVDMADRIRRNENLPLGITRESQGDTTKVMVGVGNHEELEAIKEGIAQLVSKKCKKREIEVETT